MFHDLMFSQFYIDFAFFILRFSIGIIFIFHSLSKLKKEIPFGKKYKWLNFAIGILELGGGLLIISGLWIRPVAFILSGLMLGAMCFHILIWKDKFKYGWEMPFLLFAGNLLLALTGGGNWKIVF